MAQAISIHPKVDQGFKPAAANFAGGTLQCHCADKKVSVDCDRDLLVGAVALQRASGEIRGRGLKSLIDFRMNGNSLSHGSLLLLAYWLGEAVRRLNILYA